MNKGIKVVAIFFILLAVTLISTDAYIRDVSCAVEYSTLDVGGKKMIEPTNLKMVGTGYNGTPDV
ncbi:MAG: hypothetical protein IJ675_02725, partial [Pseudobutyrivibrio sp.]|nr:hypothetical protein [Pseudobutyrivibrio sp.]